MYPNSLFLRSNTGKQKLWLPHIHPVLCHRVIDWNRKTAVSTDGSFVLSRTWGTGPHPRQVFQHDGKQPIASFLYSRTHFSSPASLQWSLLKISHTEISQSCPDLLTHFRCWWIKGDKHTQKSQDNLREIPEMSGEGLERPWRLCRGVIETPQCGELIHLNSWIGDDPFLKVGALRPWTQRLGLSLVSRAPTHMYGDWLSGAVIWVCCS